MTQPVAVVIGAGIVGCMIARELARDRRLEVIVIDRDEVGAGASRRSAGLHLPRGATPRIRRMSAFSHAYYADLKRSQPALPIHPVGATVITGPAVSGPAGYLDLAAPVLAARPVHQAVTLPADALAWQVAGCHYADVYELANALAADLRPWVRFLEGVAVTGLSCAPALEHSGAPVTIQLGTGELLHADVVALAPGPWLAAAAWRDLLAPLGLRVKKVAALHIEQRPAAADRAVVFEDEDAFLLPLPGRGHWLFSYSCQEWDVDPDKLTAGLSAAQVTAARDCLRRYSPALADACGAGRVFCDAYSPDREPVVRALDPAGRIVFAGAANGSGYRLAPAIGSEAANLLQLRRSEGATGDHQYV